MRQFNYKCVVAKNGTKMYYKRVANKWKRISNKTGMKAEKGKKKYTWEKDEVFNNWYDDLKNNDLDLDDKLVKEVHNFFKEKNIELPDRDGLTEGFGNYKEKLIKYFEENPEASEDDGNYDKIKFTILKKGTILYHRQKDNGKKRYDIWLDYSGREKNGVKLKDSFLDKPHIKEYFGDWLMKYKVNKDLIIIHFPINYDEIDKKQNKSLNVPSFLESGIRTICSRWVYKFCVDGYTLDFLKFNPNDIFKGKKNENEYREIFLYNADNLDLISEKFEGREKVEKKGLCDSWEKHGFCINGPRCEFIHRK